MKALLLIAFLFIEDAKARVAALEAQAESWQYSGQLAKAEAGYRSALEAGEAAWGESLPVAGTLARLGNVVRLQGRLDEAERIHKRALKIRERLAPDSLEVTDSLHQLFFVAWEQKDMAAMTAYSQRAMAIQERFPPDTLAMADTLNDVAMLASEQGRYAETEALFRRSVTILEKRSPGSIPLATALARLGLVTRVLGDTEAAEEHLQRALAIRNKLAPASLGTASVLANLGGLARERGDLEKAAQLLQQALTIAEKAAPTGPVVTSSLNALGIVERLRGNLDKAWELHQRALKIREQHAGLYDDVTNVLGLLGHVAEARGDLKTALELYQGSLASAERRAVPGELEKAVALQQLGRLHHRMGRSDLAAEILARAVDALESQTVRLGGTRDLQAIFRGRYEDIYLDAMEVALAQERADKAFHLLERSRARSFLTLLAERDLAFGEVPEELERSRRDIAVRYDQKTRELTQAGGEEAKATLQRELDSLRQERDEIAKKIRTASPRLAALREPQPLTLEAARKILDPGTLALSYSVGKEKTVLFAVTRDGGLQVKTLPLGEERLRREIESFLERVRSQQPPVNAADLYRELIGPVAELVERSERVLILPDGLLHRLPFGALVRNGRFLIEEKPLHTALSLTVYGTLRASSPGKGTGSLVAFGDPRFPKSRQAKSDLGPGLRGFDWSSLPYSRHEVERIAGIYPGARLYLGEEATEEHAKSIHDARILHFATHGYTDDRTPLDSALVLTIPEELPAGRGITRQNGLLQVWEIFESVRIDADLVVLSACESALGRELSGEGLIGLTRAFQYAGARSVVASLWSVADQVTAELMTRFHRHLAAGLPKDQALRAAQLELIREPLEITAASGQEIETDASTPFFWAAFQLFGDWR
jgi:CHAT domain-containing protein/Tfp pilus assembly protein PilF